jgi:hypothetical protein
MGSSIQIWFHIPQLLTKKAKCPIPVDCSIQIYLLFPNYSHIQQVNISAGVFEPISREQNIWTVMERAPSNSHLKPVRQ